MLELNNFYNIHKNVPGFVLGAGPSIASISSSDVDKICKMPCMAVNSSILFSEKVKYWVSDDIAVSNWSYFYDELKKSSCTKFMYRSKLSSFAKLFGEEKTVLFDHDWWFEPSTGRKNMAGVIIDRDNTDKIIGARTSSGSAINILAIMGCNPIILLGMDNGLVDGKRYFWESNKLIRRIDGRPNRGVWDIFDYNGVTEYFKDLFQMNKERIDIYDATPKNPMGIFPSINLKDVIND